jgi:uracil-DNA glycosylase
LDNSIRLQYLEAMGIDVWMPRAKKHGEPSISDDIEAFVENAEPEVVYSVQEKWNILQAEVADCTKCALCRTRTYTVFGTGNKNADWMIIGEAPGQNEDLQGNPFVGNAGSLLTEMLRAIGLAREDVFITNILKCRPPGNRDPKPDEVESCNDYLQRQQKLIQPKIILAVGRIAAQTLLKTDEPLAKLRSKKHTFNDMPVVVVYHPAYLLRSLSEKRKAWLDLQFAMQIYNEIEGKSCGDC